MEYKNEPDLIEMAGDDKTKRSKLQMIVDKIAEDVEPTEDEMQEVVRYSNSLMSRLVNALPKNVEIIMAGSAARGTQIRGSSDIDIFLQFPRTVDERKMEEEAMDIGKSIVDKKNEYFLINYAEHPYIKIIEKHSRMSADIVPAFKITDSSEMASSVDRTPLHNLFIKSHLSDKQKGDVRALKYFLQQHKIYGAEARINGFSGYLCEILIYSFESFANLLLYFSNTKLPIIIESINKRVVINVNKTVKIKKKFEKDFVVIDPTDSNRNVAAAVSLESLTKFVLASRALLDNPDTETFYGRKYSDLRTKSKVNGFIRRYGLKSYVLIIKTDKISEDIIWPQLTKLKFRISKLLYENHFEPVLILQNLRRNEALICIFVNDSVIKSVTDKGPSVFIHEGFDSFYRKHKKLDYMFIDEDKLKIIKESRFRTVKSIFKYILNDKKFGFPSHLQKHNSRLLSILDEKHAKYVWEEINRMII